MNLSTLLRVALPFVLSAAVATASDKAPPTYQNGSVQGWDIRVDTGDSGNGSMTRCHAKVYELSGSDLVLKIDYCRAFQAGTFGIGQVVEYRVEGERLYIRYDGDKEYKCKIEGTKAAGAAPATP
jgi:hypothetical protein